MTVQLSFNDFAITIRATYFYLISCSVILFQPISIVLSVLLIMLFRFFFMSFIILFVFFRMFFSEYVLHLTLFIALHLTQVLYIIYHIVYPRYLFICSSSLMYLHLQLEQTIYVSCPLCSVIFIYTYICIVSNQNPKTVIIFNSSS